MVFEFIFVNEKFSGLSLFLIVMMFGWLVKFFLERFKIDFGIFGFIKNLFSVV